MSLLWQRFTERAKRVVIAAQNEAARRGEPYVSPEHLLIAILQMTDSPASKVLERLGVSAPEAQEELERQIGGREHEALDKNAVTLSPRLKRVMDLAYDEARETNRSYIGTEHLLVGIIREFEGVAFKTLTALGVDLVATRKEIVAYLGVEDPYAPDAARTQAKSHAMKLRPEFTQTARDAVLTAQSDAARDGDPYVSPERLLLGILKYPEPGVLAIFANASIDVRQVQDRVERQIKNRVSGRIKIDDVTLDPSVKRVLDYALDESRNTLDTHIWPEHLLLGILRIEAGSAFEILEELGMDISGARAAVARFHSPGMLGSLPKTLSLRNRPTAAHSPSQPTTEDHPVCEMGKFADPDAASAWLNEMALAGYHLSEASATRGELWLTVERGRR